MPFTQISAQCDSFNVYWHSNLPNNDVTHIGSNGRATLLMLVPGRMSVDLLDKQFNDPTLEPYNVIAFDYPGYGHTKCGHLRDQLLELDDWVMAACVSSSLRLYTCSSLTLVIQYGRELLPHSEHSRSAYILLNGLGISCCDSLCHPVSYNLS